MNLVTLVLQIAVVLGACRLMGALFLKIRQPQVNGEMFAGILLGPSLLGRVAPHLSATIFPASSLDFLNAFGQVGVTVFMFLVGLSLNLKELKSQAKAAAVTSFVSIAAPFGLAWMLSIWLYPRVADPGVKFVNFAMFMGAGMMITAFPMLARILSERNMTQTRLGTVAITCAALSGIASWCALAYIVVLVKASGSTSELWWTFGGLVALMVVMVMVGGRLLQVFEKVYQKTGKLSDNWIALIVVIMLAAGVGTGKLGVHPLFGAFLVGAVMPKENKFSRYLADRFEAITLTLLLPLYFAFTGLRTNVGVVKGREMWMYCLLIILVATVGKLVCSMLSAWATGMRLRESAGLGALLNTRGLITLVVLNIGYDLKVVSVAVFSMMVVMALVTTVMTTWLLDVFCPPSYMDQITSGETARPTRIPALADAAAGD